MKKLNNKGAALVTVIVVVAFISILATTILYATAMNNRTKQADYLNKKSFYTAEMALDYLKSQLVMQDMSDAFTVAYTQTMEQYASDSFDDGASRQALFNDLYLDELQSIWEGRANDAMSHGKTLLDELKSLASDKYASQYVDPETDSSGNLLSGQEPLGYYRDDENNRFVLTNVRIRYVENGYASYIVTDIAMCVPQFNVTANGYTSTSENTPATIDDREYVELSDYIIYLNWKKY